MERGSDPTFGRWRASTRYTDHAPMPRMPRYFVEGVPQHVVQRGNDRRPIFLEQDDYSHFLACLLSAARKHGAAIHAYVLMTNHVHLLMTPTTPASVPKTMQSTFSRYVTYFNARNERTGTLLESRYRATIVEEEHYLVTCMRYIELNPVRAGMVNHPAEYRWSSFRANAFGAPDDLLTPHPAFRTLGVSRDDCGTAYVEHFRGAIPVADLDRIRDATQHAWAIGGKRFLERTGSSGRRPERLPSGRPRRSGRGME